MDVTEGVRAAGGVIWRRRPDGHDPEVLLVHRPRYDDWTLPKGKLLPGEGDADGALREVEEETGMHCSLGPVVGTIRYRDRFDRPKVVVYFEMRPGAGSFEPNDEVDVVRWLARDDAVTTLTYPHDRALLEGFVPAA
jgi:8-oxo-dGTP diphosphatase